MGLIGALQDWRERREILRDIRRRRAEEAEVLQFKVKDQLTYALSGLERDDRAYANRIWDTVAVQYPEIARLSPLSLKLLLGLRRFDEAEIIMRALRAKHPNDPDYAVGLAEVFHEKKDYVTAIQLWTAARKRFPGVSLTYSREAEALAAVGRLDDAEKLAVKAMELFPDHLGAFLEYARASEQRQDLEQALVRWTMIQERFGYGGAFVAAGRILSRLGRYSEADALISTSRLRFGTDPSFVIEFARSAEARGDVPEAIQRWKGVLYRFPLYIFAYFDAADAFYRLNDPTEAEATLRASVERFENEPRPTLELAKYYHYKILDFKAAAEAWRKLRQTFPDIEEAYTAGANALERANLSEEAEALRAEHKARFNP